MTETKASQTATGDGDDLARRVEAHFAAAARWADHGDAPALLSGDFGTPDATDRTGARLWLNREINVLTPVLLNGCHKRAAGAGLTRLETVLVDAIATDGGDDLVRGLGAMYARMPGAQRARLFAPEVAHLEPGGSVEWDDLAAWWPRLVARVEAMPNNPAGPEDTVAFADVDAYGWTTAPLPVPRGAGSGPEPGAVAAPESAPASGTADDTVETDQDSAADPRVRVAFNNLICTKWLDSTGPEDVYVTYTYSDGRHHATGTSRYYKGIREGETRTMDDLIYEGPLSGTPALSLQAWKWSGASESAARHAQNLRDASETFIKSGELSEQHGGLEGVSKAQNVVGGILRLVAWAIDGGGDTFIGYAACSGDWEDLDANHYAYYRSEAIIIPGSMWAKPKLAGKLEWADRYASYVDLTYTETGLVHWERDNSLAAVPGHVISTDLAGEGTAYRLDGDRWHSSDLRMRWMDQRTALAVAEAGDGVAGAGGGSAGTRGVRYFGIDYSGAIRVEGPARSAAELEGHWPGHAVVRRPLATAAETRRPLLFTASERQMTAVHLNEQTRTWSFELMPDPRYLVSTHSAMAACGKGDETYVFFMRPGGRPAGLRHRAKATDGGGFAAVSAEFLAADDEDFPHPHGAIAACWGEEPTGFYINRAGTVKTLRLETGGGPDTWEVDIANLRATKAALDTSLAAVASPAGRSAVLGSGAGWGPGWGPGAGSAVADVLGAGSGGVPGPGGWVADVPGSVGGGADARGPGGRAGDGAGGWAAGPPGRGAADAPVPGSGGFDVALFYLSDDGRLIGATRAKGAGVHDWQESVLPGSGADAPARDTPLKAVMGGAAQTIPIVYYRSANGAVHEVYLDTPSNTWKHGNLTTSATKE